MIFVKRNLFRGLWFFLLKFAAGTSECRTKFSVKFFLSFFYFSVCASVFAKNIFADINKYYSHDLSSKFQEKEIFYLDSPSKISGFFTTNHRQLTFSSVFPSAINFNGSSVSFSDKSGIVIQNPAKDKTFYRIEVLLEDVSQTDLTGFLTGIDVLWSADAPTTGLSVGLDTANSPSTYWFDGSNFKTESEVSASEYEFSRLAQSRLLRRRLGEVKVEIFVTPVGIYAMVDGMNLGSFPDLYTGPYTLDSQKINFIVLGKWNSGGNPVSFKNLKIYELDDSLSSLDEINAHFIKKTVESDAFSSMITGLSSDTSGGGNFSNALWLAFVYRAYDYYFRTDHRADVQDLVDFYLSYLPAYVDRYLPLYDSVYAGNLNHGFVNSLQSDPFVVYGIYDYLRRDQVSSVQVQYARIIDKTSAYIFRENCQTVNRPNTGINYNFKWNDCFPTNIWYVDDTYAEEVSWLLSFYAGYYANFPYDSPRSTKVLDYLTFLGFHHLSSGFQGQEGSSIRQVFGDQIKFNSLPDRFLDFKSQYIWNDGLVDNHDFHPSVNYSMGTVGTVAIVKNILEKNSISLPVLNNNLNLVYQKSLKEKLDTTTFRHNQWIPKNTNQFKTDNYIFSPNGSLIDFYGASNPSRVEDWAAVFSNYHLFENMGDYAVSDAFSKNVYYKFFSGSGKFFCSHFDSFVSPDLDKCDFPWVKNSLSSLLNKGNETYSSLTAFIYSQNDNSLLRQSFLSADGKTVWFRECAIISSGIGSCSGSLWQSVSLNNLRGSGGESYRDIEFFIWPKTSGKILFQSFLSTDGKTLWSRECSLLSSGIGQCGSSWQNSDLSNLTGQGNESFLSYSAFSYPRENENRLFQSFLSSDGKTLISRDCPIDSCGGVSWEKKNLSEVAEVKNLQVKSYKAYLYPQFGEYRLRQHFLNQSGNELYYRDCYLQDQKCSASNKKFFNFLFSDALYSLLFSLRSDFQPKTNLEKDLNNDSLVNSNDLLYLLPYVYRPVENCLRCDLSGDDKINQVDVAVFLNE